MLIFAVIAAVLSADQMVFQKSKPYQGQPLVRICDDSILTNDNYDVWSRGADGCLIARVKSGASELQAEVLVEDIQQLVDQDAQMNVRGQDWFKAYHPYEDIKEWYTKLSQEHAGVTFIESIGKSTQGRDLFAVKINKNGATKQIYWQSLIHSREWIGGATVMYVVNELLEKYAAGDKEVKSLLDSVELLVVPVVNPDGYHATWNGQRLHRKNKRDQYGVDLNRNFDFHWDSDTGTSRSKYSEVYKGPSVASEPETQAVVRFFKNQTGLVGAIDFHSYSQLVLRPYGHTAAELPPHNEQLTRVGDGIARQIYGVSRKKYQSIPSVQLYPTSGTTFDWFYDQQDKKYRAYGYTIELRPANAFGGQGFLLSPSQIIPTGQEIYAAMKFFIKSVVEDPLIN